MVLHVVCRAVDAGFGAVGLGPERWRERSALTFAANVAMNAFNGSDAMAARIGLESNRAVSSRFPLLVTPAGYAFAIWGPIFLGEAVYTVWELSGKQDEEVKNGELLRHTATMWQAVNIQQTLWGAAFGTGRVGVAAVLLTGIAMGLDNIHQRRGKEEVGASLITQTPFTMHFAWTVAAALINWNMFLKTVDAPPVVRDGVAALSIVAAGLNGIWTALTRCDSTVALVTAWALYAISVKDKDLTAIGTTLSPDGVSLLDTTAKALAATCVGVAAFVPFLRTWLT
eukprot:TRINITY_DN25712_c0_g1_i1.p2 TRINITY_DN25712_c0_g1~~TRINITY_DN25712_c0_g1_i1.p2  ORF type:complete len:284 (+),score=107.29 TRINITY_DN25712_c0_g1_i1:46-897(+)